jgi:protein-S-isoprenylcysteine O-methyltransferase Ste14
MALLVPGAVAGINAFYWIFLESLVRKPESKLLGTQSSSLIPKEYKNTSQAIVGSTVFLYVLALLWRLSPFEIYPLHCYRDQTFSSWLSSSLPIVVSVTAFLLRYRAMKVLGKYFSRRLVVQSSQEIIQEGPYAFVRHPGYSANVLLYLAYALTVSGDLVVGALLWLQYLFVLLAIRIPGEEEMLLSDPQTAEGYKRYQRKVPHRIVPLLC